MSDLSALELWRRLENGVEVAVAAQTPAQLLGVRDGLLRYCRQHFGPQVPIAVVPQPVPLTPHGLPATDEEALDRLHELVTRIYADVGQQYHFTVAAEGSLHSVQVAGQPHRFVRCWAVVRGLAGQAFGGSGSIEVPERIAGGLGGRPAAAAVLGTRRRGGLTQAITGGAENRRRATCDATFYAFSSLLGGAPGRR